MLQILFCCHINDELALSALVNLNQNTSNQTLATLPKLSQQLASWGVLSRTPLVYSAANTPTISLTSHSSFFLIVLSSAHKGEAGFANASDADCLLLEASTLPLPSPTSCLLGIRFAYHYLDFSLDTSVWLHAAFCFSLVCHVSEITQGQRQHLQSVQIVLHYTNCIRINVHFQTRTKYTCLVQIFQTSEMNSNPLLSGPQYCGRLLLLFSLFLSVRVFLCSLGCPGFTV